ncbi:uncharacterized protein RHOBADRAFT_49517, partial [Rhodotorula graminis WP1]
TRTSSSPACTPEQHRSTHSPLLDHPPTNHVAHLGRPPEQPRQHAWHPRSRRHRHLPVPRGQRQARARAQGPRRRHRPALDPAPLRPPPVQQPPLARRGHPLVLVRSQPSDRHLAPPARPLARLALKDTLLAVDTLSSTDSQSRRTQCSQPSPS